MKKQDIKKIIESIKSRGGAKITHTQGRIDIDYRERDMRQEAMDMGAHQAKEFFGEKNEG